MDHVRTAADGAIFDIGLPCPSRPINGDDNRFAAFATGISRLVLHFPSLPINGVRGGKESTKVNLYHTKIAKIGYFWKKK